MVDSSPVSVTLTSDFTPASSKKFPDIQATIEHVFTLKCVRNMTRTYRQAKLDVYSSNSHNLKLRICYKSSRKSTEFILWIKKIKWNLKRPFISSPLALRISLVTPLSRLKIQTFVIRWKWWKYFLFLQ